MNFVAICYPSFDRQWGIAIYNNSYISYGIELSDVKAVEKTD